MSKMGKFFSFRMRMKT